MVEPSPLPKVCPHEKYVTPSSTQAPPATPLVSLPGSSWLHRGLPVFASKAFATGLAGLPSAVKPATTSPTTTGDERHVPWMLPHGCAHSVSPVAASRARNSEPPPCLRAADEPLRVTNSRPRSSSICFQPSTGPLSRLRQRMRPVACSSAASVPASETK